MKIRTGRRYAAGSENMNWNKTSLLKGNPIISSAYYFLNVLLALLFKYILKSYGLLSFNSQFCSIFPFWGVVGVCLNIIKCVFNTLFSSRCKLLSGIWVLFMRSILRRLVITCISTLMLKNLRILHTAYFSIHYDPYNKQELFQRYYSRTGFSSRSKLCFLSRTNFSYFYMQCACILFFKSLINIFYFLYNTAITI